MLKSKLVVILALALVLLVGAGCQKEYIPNTEIPDNDFNREVLEFCERYRHGVEDLNIGVLMSLVSDDYLDNRGTPNGDDDIDRDKLEQIFIEEFAPIASIRYEIKYRDIFTNDGDIYVQFTYTMSFQYSIEGKKKWHNHTADERLVIKKDNDKFEIFSGM